MVAEHSGGGIRPEINPDSSLRTRVDTVLRATLPTVGSLLAILILSAPLDLPGQSALLFAVLFGSVFFWSSQRTRLMPSPCAFGLGLCAESVTFGPPGVLLFVILLGHGIGHIFRRWLSASHFTVSWLVLGGLAVIAAFLQWLVASIEAFRMLSIASSLFQTALTIGIYPLLSALFSWSNRKFAPSEQA